jgi:hypothetical protein
MTTFSVDAERLEKLLEYCLGFAKQMIEAHGEFHPFGAVIDSQGQHVAVGAHTGKELPPGAEVYSLLQNSMKAQFLKKEILATAIAANVNIPAQFNPPCPDGIRVHLECAGFSWLFYLPYRISNGQVEYAEFITADVGPAVCSGNPA